MLALLLVAQTLRITIPLALAAAGGSICERSGIINIALEAMLLLGAFGYVLAAHAAAIALGVGGDAGLLPHLVVAIAGLGGAILGGIFVAAIHALVTITFRADQVVSGVALNLLAAGLSKFILKLVFNSSSNSTEVLGLPSIPGLHSIPALGIAVGEVLLWIGAIAVAAAHVALFRAVWGLRVRAAGEHPAAAEGAGISVARVRWMAVLASGVLASLGGAWLAADERRFTEGMSSGRGYVALAAVVFGKWRPGWAAAACLLFAFVDAAQIQLQGIVPLPSELLQILPYVVALFVLAGAVGAARPPASLGKPWPE